MRRAPTPLTFEDIGRAAHALARLPDADGGTLVALAWAAVNFFRAIHEDEDEICFPLSIAVEQLIELGTGGVTLAARGRSRQTWIAMSALAAALACHGDDPSLGATHFHHGSVAPDWALEKEPSFWLNRWALYGAVSPVGPAGADATSG